jgi:Holliday junction resolvasome RuvABC endonuclease subunit
MRVLGIDASTTKTGYALASGGAPEACGLWKPPSKLKQQHERIEWTAAQAHQFVLFTRPDLVVIEECGPTKNTKTFRALVRAESIVAHECRKAGAQVLLVMVKAAREAALDDGKLGKIHIYEMMKAQYPQYAWPENDPEGEKGGNDMSDALVMALGGEKLLSRV